MTSQDDYADLAAHFGKIFCAPLEKAPDDAYWYAWNGKVEDAVLFMDTRKFERFENMAELLNRPDIATGAVVFFNG
jgi:hypothetical protein